MIITMAINAKIISIKIIMIAFTRAVFDEEYWVGYRTVNEKFAEETLKALRGMEKVFFFIIFILPHLLVMTKSVIMMARMIQAMNR